MIADADPADVSALKTILASDYDIKIATDCRKALRLSSSSDAPGLILLGDMGPTADMYDLCTTLKADNATKGIPILMLAEPSTADTEARGFELGAADYLTRPFKPSVVLARVRTHLELKRYRENLETSVKRQVNELHEEVRQRRDTEDTYRALVEHAHDGIAIIHDFRVKLANPAFANMIGIPEKELIGAHLKTFISEEEFVKNTTRYSNRIAGLNLPRIYKSQMIHSDGYTIDVELNVCVVPYGRSLAALVFVRDIREEKAWEYLR